MKKITFYLVAFTIVFSTLSFGSPATDYTFVREFGQSGIESNRFKTECRKAKIRTIYL